MGYAQKLRKEVEMVRNVTAFLAKMEANEKAHREKVTKKDVALQANLLS